MQRDVRPRLPPTCEKIARRPAAPRRAEVSAGERSRPERRRARDAARAPRPRALATSRHRPRPARPTPRISLFFSARAPRERSRGRARALARARERAIPRPSRRALTRSLGRPRALVPARTIRAERARARSYIPRFLSSSTSCSARARARAPARLEATLSPPSPPPRARRASARRARASRPSSSARGRPIAIALRRTPLAPPRRRAVPPLDDRARSAAVAARDLARRAAANHAVAHTLRSAGARDALRARERLALPRRRDGGRRSGAIASRPSPRRGRAARARRRRRRALSPLCRRRSYETGGARLVRDRRRKPDHKAGGAWPLSTTHSRALAAAAARAASLGCCAAWSGCDDATSAAERVGRPSETCANLEPATLACPPPRFRRLARPRRRGGRRFSTPSHRGC